MIFANHAHVYPGEIRQSGTVEALKTYMQQCGVDKAVAFAPFQSRVNEASLDIKVNDWLEKEIAGDSSLVGFGTVDFTAGDLTSQVRHIFDLGFKGIKIHPAVQQLDIVGKQAFEVYEQAQKLGLFLSFHTGLHWHRLKDYAVILYDEVAYNFPSLKFSMEHMGGYSFFGDAIAVMCNNQRDGNNVYAGWTSIAMYENGLPGSWSITDEQLRTLILQTGEKNSIFGLDFPFKNAQQTIDAIERIRNLDISESAKEAVLGGNLTEVLGCK